MKCREFQTLIPKIVNNEIPDSELDKVINHVTNCKDCYDEMEIYYVLQYGLSDSDNNDMDFVGQLNDKIRHMKGRARHFEFLNSAYNTLYVLSNAAVIIAAVYFLFAFL